MSENKINRLSQLDILKVLAAFFVCVYHLHWVDSSILSTVFRYGYLGVNVFFCISGFITPLVLIRGKYDYSKIFSFIVSRFFRLYPAFAFIAIVEIYLYYNGCSFMGYGSHPDKITWARTLANFTFTADFFKIDWYIAVFWTLAVEVQFYLFLLLIFPLFNKPQKWIAPLIIILITTGPILFGKGDTLFTYTPLFSCGLTVFLYHSKRINYPVMLALLTLCTFIESTHISSYAAYTAAATALAIVHLPQLESKVIKFLSNISYSFFLIHITIGGATLYKFHYLPETWHYQLPLVIFATILSAIVASLFHLYVENPLHRYSRKFRDTAKT